MSDYQIQQYTPDLWKQVCKIQSDIWMSSTKLAGAYLDWKYVRNPYIQEPLIYVASYNDQVVAMRAMYGTCWEAGEDKQNLILPLASDAGISPEHRDRGIFQELSNYAADDLRTRGYSHILNFSPTPSNYVVSIMTMGWKRIGSKETLSRYSNIKPPQQSSGDSAGETASRSSTGENLKRRVVNVGVSTGRKIKKALGVHAFTEMDQNIRKQGNHLSLSKEPRPQQMQNLIQQLGSDGRLRQIRDQTYFAWRFGNPLYTYRFLFWGDDEIDGYLILQNVVGRRQVNIIDWEGRNSQIRAGLLDAAIRLGQFKTMTIWGATLSDSTIETLQKIGFSNENSGRDSFNRHGQFMLKQLASEPSDGTILGRNPLDKNSWDLRTVYSEEA
ncbi:MAG: GNAT family N-acetyltransferase [Pontiella sp.]